MRSPPLHDPAYSTAAAAEYIGSHPKTLLRAAREGKIAFIRAKNGRRLKFRLSDLNEYLDSLRVPAKKISPKQEPDWGA
ncbi:MAG TPA: DNA-binding protein [Phycisphaerales bacterium]|nr:DNA-binding protein [Phycisphaerales bacterium]